MPVEVHYRDEVTRTSVTPWVVNLSTLIGTKDSLKTSVLFEQRGINIAGLYCVYGEKWNYIIPLDAVNSYVVNGGKIDIYVDLNVIVPVESGSIVYQNGREVNVTQLVPLGENIIWAVVSAPASSSGTLTSAALSMPSDFSVSGSPITKSGVFTVTRNAQPAHAVLIGPPSGDDAVPSFRTLTEADTPYAAPIDSPTFTTSAAGPNAAWPAAYDDPDVNGNYKPGGTSELATRDLVKNVVAGALGNYSSINQFNVTPTQLPVSGGSGILWAANFQSAQGSAVLPALSAENYPNPTAAVGTTYSFANIGIQPFILEVGQGGDTIVWGNYSSLSSIIINPGESLQVTFMFWNGTMQWLVSGGTTLPWADNSYSVDMLSGKATAVPITAVGKEQIIMNGALVKTFADGVEVPPILELPSNGEWTVINMTTGGVTILLANSIVSGATIPLISGCNTHVATGPYGIKTASGSINGGSIELIAYAAGGNLNVVPGQLLYDTLLFIDDPNGGNLTANVTYVFDPAVLPSRSGRWSFYNNLQQSTSFTVSVADTQGNSYVVPKGQVVNVLYLPDGKLIKI